MNTMINYEGIDEATLIHALYRGTRPLGMGILHNRPDLSKEDIERAIEVTPEAYRWDFDYLFGRPLKLRLDTKAKTFEERLYDRDAGTGRAQEIVDRLKAGK